MTLFYRAFAVVRVLLTLTCVEMWRRWWCDEDGLKMGEASRNV
jgi:hypothetical protein